MEYLLIVAIAFIIIVPAAFVFYNYSKESSQEISDSEIAKLGKAIVDAAEVVYYSGEGAKTVLELNVPDNLANTFIVDGRELVLNMTTSFGNSEVVFFSSVNLTTDSSNCVVNVCNVPQLNSSGLKKIKIESIGGDDVNISMK